MQIRPMREGDAAAVLAIYRAGIETGHATFETEPPAWDRWDDGHLAACRLVAEADGEVLGWAALSPVSSRPVYRGVAEVSLYLALAARGRGLGRQLLEALIEASEAAGIWTLQAGVFPENEASMRLHQALGFRALGTRERVGRMAHGPMRGRWRDVVLLERRSAVTGLD
ncbi:MAG: N-acetyltransferase family protein [Alphaproteobacteria bacterium]|jgi:phosphinothricin acetyltransferase|nr:N-acetyltransferase family protein [Alphaproteobacteria bacterium]